jgi:hypothetical protein
MPRKGFRTTASRPIGPRDPPGARRRRCTSSAMKAYRQRPEEGTDCRRGRRHRGVMKQHDGSKSDPGYRRWWLIVATALISIGMLSAAAASLVALADSFVTFALVGAAVVVLAGQPGVPGGHNTGGREILMGALAAGTFAGTFLGLTTIIGASAIVVVLVVAVASPWVVGANWRWMDCEVDTVLWGLCYSPPPLRFQLPRSVESACDPRLSTLDWDELPGNQDGR